MTYTGNFRAALNTSPTLVTIVVGGEGRPSSSSVLANPTLLWQTLEVVEVGQGEAREFLQPVAAASKQIGLFVRGVQNIEPAAAQQFLDAMEVSNRIEPEARRAIKPSAVFGESGETQRIGVDDFDVKAGAPKPGQRLPRRKAGTFRHQHPDF